MENDTNDTVKAVINPKNKPMPTNALLAADSIKTNEQVVTSVTERATVTWECDEMGFTVNGEYRVGKVVGSMTQTVLGYILYPTHLEAQSRNAQRLMLANVPFICIPKGMPEDKVKAACEKMKMPRWFSNGTPPRKSPAKSKTADNSGWEV